MTKLILAVSLAFTACDTRVNVPPSEEKHETNIVNPPAQKTESETTITSDQGGVKTEKKTETTH